MSFKINPLTGKQIRGFAAMPRDKVVEIARIGGASTPADKRSFSQDPDLARAAGRKGGEATRKRAA